MTHHPALLVLLLTLTSPPHPGTRTAAQSYQGTVHAILAHPAAIDLVTGVGHSLRMVRVLTVPTTIVDSAGTAIPMAQLQAGDVVRADCRSTPTGLFADHIEKLSSHASRGTP